MKKRGVGFGKRAQAAIFIIMSLIIMISGLVYFIYQDRMSEEAETVQPEAQPVNFFVESCVQQVAEEGMHTIGLTGGYTYIPPEIESDPRAHLSDGAFFKMPYWWHDGISAMPSEEYIRSQLESYIQNELNGCLQGFASFGEQFEITPLDDPITSVSLNENDVSIALKYPVEVISRNGNFRALLEKFSYTSPIRLKKIHSLAKTIMERENADAFFEQRAIELYSINRNIPTTDIQATCSPKAWKLIDIKDEISKMLRVNMPYVRIEGTSYDPNMYVPNPSGKQIYSDTYFQKHYVWNIDNDAGEKYSGMKVSFKYDNWPLQINARPSENGILKSNSEKGSKMLSFFCLHIWHFTYDMNYPLVATIVDDSNSNSPYQFSFAFKTSIDHNQPNRLSRGTTAFEAPDNLPNEEYCSDVQNEISIFTVDNATNEDISDVNIDFACGRYSCEMGKSGWLSLGAAAGISKKFPYCVNGIIKASKPGYIETQSFVQTDVDGRSYVLLLNPVKELDYKIVKHPYTNPLLEEDIGENEKVSVIISAKGASYETFAVYPKEAEYPLQLPSGKDMSYDVMVYIADGEELKGGYIGQWDVNQYELEGAKEAVFHVMEYDAQSEDEQLFFMSGLESYSRNIPAPELR